MHCRFVRCSFRFARAPFARACSCDNFYRILDNNRYQPQFAAHRGRFFALVGFRILFAKADFRKHFVRGGFGFGYKQINNRTQRDFRKDRAERNTFYVLQKEITKTRLTLRVNRSYRFIVLYFYCPIILNL